MPMKKSDYPANWQDLRKQVVDRAKNRCECTGQCGLNHLVYHSATGLSSSVRDGAFRYRCGQANGEKLWCRKCYATGKIDAVMDDPSEHPRQFDCGACEGVGRKEAGKVVLTVAHTCHDSKCDKPGHLLLMCQTCHLRLDTPQHVANAIRTREEKRGQSFLFPKDAVK